MLNENARQSNENARQSSVRTPQPELPIRHESPIVKNLLEVAGSTHRIPSRARRWNGTGLSKKGSPFRGSTKRTPLAVN
jgi:hypothetical protein